MPTTALNLVKFACYESNIPAPTTLVGNTEPQFLQLLHLFHAVGRELRSLSNWPQLKRKFTISLVAGRTQYHLPEDFYCPLPRVFWDKSNSNEAIGPIDDGAWNNQLYGPAVIVGGRPFKIFGPDNPNDSRGQFYISPTPGAGEQDQRITVEYISRNWLNPKHWVAGASVGATDSVNCNGNIYTHTVGTTNGTVAPSVAYGVGQDGQVFSKVISVAAWQSATVYAPGAYATNGGNLYVSTTGGTSAGSGGPTGTTEDTDITDNTVTWNYLPFAAWAAQTSYEEGDVYTAGSTRYYLVLEGGVSGSTTPTWTISGLTHTQSDGAITWTFSTSAYETLGADTDICLFDDEIMICGLQAFFLRARGLKWQDKWREYKELKSAAAGRFGAGRIIDMAGGYGSYYPNIPAGNWGQ